MSKLLQSRTFISLFLVLCSLQVAPALAQDPAIAVEAIDHWDGIDAAEAISQSTGIAISPLLGVGALGAWTYFQVPAAQRDQLPWFAKAWFWIPALLLVALMVAKDPLLGFLPMIKKPLDALDVVEDKISAVLASAVVIPMLYSVFSRALPDNGVAAAATSYPFLLALTMPEFLSGLPGMILIGLAIVGLLVTFFVTWLAAHTINVLILLSPFGPLDIALRAIKGIVLLVLLLATLIAPVLGLLVSVVIFVVAWRISGWSFRFTVFGSVMAWDVLSLRQRRIEPETEPIKAFSGPTLADVANRTYGEIRRDQDADPVFVSRPWLMLPERSVPLTHGGELEVGKGLLTPIMLGTDDEADENRNLARFPPRFLGHEEILAERLDARRVRLLGVRKQFKNLKDWIGAAWSGVWDKVPIG